MADRKQRLWYALGGALIAGNPALSVVNFAANDMLLGACGVAIAVFTAWSLIA